MASIAIVTWLMATAATAERGAFLADLPADERATLAESLADNPLPDDPEGILTRLFTLAPAHRFDGGLVIVDTDRRWFRASPPSGPGAAILELRRWPGDTVMTFYVLRGAAPTEGYAPPVPSATLEGPVVGERLWWWEGTLETRSGTRRAVWIERGIEGGAGRLGVLMLPGDAGLGESSIREREIEARFVLGRMGFREEAWVEIGDEAVEGPIILPHLGLAPRPWDEREDAWQIARGFGFTLGLPPGLHAMALTPSFPGPHPVSGGAMWFRGRFLNSQGDLVVIGDGSRGGYVVEVADPSPEWTEGKHPPAAALSSKLVKGVALDLATERTGATAARAERWSEPGFAGEWLVFRLVFEAGGIEIDIPVVQGRSSEALFWIPVSWRPNTMPPAPPPVDPASRFGIKFEKLGPVAQTHEPWIEGYLIAPGLRLGLPKDWWPVASLRSTNGFPIRIIDVVGATQGWLVRAEPGDPVLEPSEDGTWVPVPQPKRYRAAVIYAREDGTRVYVAREGHGFVLRPEPGSGVDEARWQNLVESVFLTRTK